MSFTPSRKALSSATRVHYELGIVEEKKSGQIVVRPPKNSVV